MSYDILGSSVSNLALIFAGGFHIMCMKCGKQGLVTAWFVIPKLAHLFTNFVCFHPMTHLYGLSHLRKPIY